MTKTAEPNCNSRLFVNLGKMTFEDFESPTQYCKSTGPGQAAKNATANVTEDCVADNTRSRVAIGCSK